MDNWCKWDSDRHGIMGFGYYISQHGSCYFKVGENTVSQIGAHYCAPPQNWIANVKGNMTKLYAAAGITISSINIPANGSFLQIAKTCHDYLKVNNYYYSSAENKRRGYAYDNEDSTGSCIPKPYEGEGNYIDCSAYVTWVLYEYGYKELKGWQLTVPYVSQFCIKNGFQQININNIQPGDILINGRSHTEIYWRRRKNT